MRERIFGDFLCVRVDFQKPVREKLATPKWYPSPDRSPTGGGPFSSGVAVLGVRLRFADIFAVFIRDVEILRNYRVQEHVVDLSCIGVDVRHAISGPAGRPRHCLLVGREVIIALPGAEE